MPDEQPPDTDVVGAAIAVVLSARMSFPGIDGVMVNLTAWQRLVGTLVACGYILAPAPPVEQPPSVPFPHLSTCPACRHERHRTACPVPTSRWRRWLSGLPTCSCTYWDARWSIGPA